MKGKVIKLMDLSNVMLDISTMPAAVLIDITEQWLDRFDGYATPVPLVAIAHTKNFTDASARNMSEYLIWAKAEGIEMRTYGQWLEAQQ